MHRIYPKFPLCPAVIGKFCDISPIFAAACNNITTLCFIQGSVQEMLNLSQQEYVNRIDELNSQLILAWDQDQRVKALKIAIQVRKERVNDDLSVAAIH